MKIEKMLVWTHEYLHPMPVMARTPDEEAQAWLFLLQEFHLFGQLENLDLEKVAKAGDAEAARKLLEVDGAKIFRENAVIPDSALTGMVAQPILED